MRAQHRFQVRHAASSARERRARPGRGHRGVGILQTGKQCLPPIFDEFAFARHDGVNGPQQRPQRDAPPTTRPRSASGLRASACGSRRRSGLSRRDRAGKAERPPAIRTLTLQSRKADRGALSEGHPVRAAAEGRFTPSCRATRTHRKSGGRHCCRSGGCKRRDGRGQAGRGAHARDAGVGPGSDARAHDALGQAVANAEKRSRVARRGLRQHCRKVDRMNKRVFKVCRPRRRRFRAGGGAGRRHHMRADDAQSASPAAEHRHPRRSRSRVVRGDLRNLQLCGRLRGVPNFPTSSPQSSPRRP